MGTTANIRTGAFAYLQYDFECTFDTGGTPATVAGKVFGFEQRITGWTWTNNRIVLNQLNSVEPKTFAYGQARGSMSVDFVVSNPWFNSLLFDRADCIAMCFPACVACVAPFTYNWAPTCNVGTKDVESFTAQVGIEAGGTDVVRLISGGIVNSVSLRSTVGEVVRATADITYATDGSMCTIDACPASDPVGTGNCQFIPYTFAHGTLEVPCGSVIAELQSFDLTLNQNADLLWGHNSNHAVNAFRRVFEMTGTFNASYVDNDQLNDLYAQIGDNCITQLTEIPTLQITLNNGEAGAAQRNLVYTFTGVAPSEHSTAIEPVEPIFENITWQARSATVTSINATSAEP